MHQGRFSSKRASKWPLVKRAVGEVAPLTTAVGGPSATDLRSIAPYLSEPYAAVEGTTRAIALTRRPGCMAPDDLVLTHIIPSCSKEE